MNYRHMTSATSTFAVLIGALAILASSLGAVTPAAAEPARQERFGDERPRQTVVRFGDLDLSHAEGRTVLHSRLKRAARNVCATNSTPFVQARQRERECEAQTLRVALAEVAPTLMLAASR
jgi:UrcA family protein